MITILAWLRWAVEQIGQWWQPPVTPPGGGTVVGGNVRAGRDFVGRDRIQGEQQDSEQ